MKSIRKALISGLLLAGLIPFTGSAWAYNSGRFTSSNTGGPFPGEQVCTRCHVGSDANSGDGTVELLIGDAAASEFSYTPGETVSLILNFTDANASRSGFQLTVRSGDGCGQPGSVAAGSGDNGSTVQVREGTCGTGTIQWATHRRVTTGTSATWDIDWTAPAESAGTVTIAVAVNGANGNGARTGDSIYTYTATIEPAAATAPAPVISDSGVVLADLFSETTTGAPNALAAVLGSGFSEAAAPISGTVDDSGKVSTVLDGTCVEVNQHRAPLVQIASDEITFQIPADTGLGAASVKVIRGCDTDDETSSNSAQFQVAAVKPVFFLFSDSSPGIAALHLDLSLVAAADAVSGRVTRPALPGEVVTFFGTGFGPTVPTLDTGEIAVQPQSLETSDLRPMIGELEVAADDILYAGAAPNFAGLYQLSLKIPRRHFGRLARIFRAAGRGRFGGRAAARDRQSSRCRGDDVHSYHRAAGGRELRGGGGRSHRRIQCERERTGLHCRGHGNDLRRHDRFRRRRRGCQERRRELDDYEAPPILPRPWRASRKNARRALS